MWVNWWEKSFSCLSADGRGPSCGLEVQKRHVSSHGLQLCGMQPVKRKARYLEKNSSEENFSEDYIMNTLHVVGVPFWTDPDKFPDTMKGSNFWRRFKTGIRK